MEQLIKDIHEIIADTEMNEETKLYFISVLLYQFENK